VLPCAKVLSKMSEEQAAMLREVEREYEEVLDENCRVLAEYFKEVLVNENSDAGISPPSLIMKSGAEGGGRENITEEITRTNLLENGRYNVMLYIYFSPIRYSFQINCFCYLRIKGKPYYLTHMQVTSILILDFYL